MGSLVDLIPAKYRKVLYGVLAFALAVYAIWRAVEGDWTQFAVSLTTSLVNVLATANTNVPPVEAVGVE